MFTPDLDRVLASGAEVEVDDGADAPDGVYVGWLISPRLRERAGRAFRLRLLDDPVLCHSSEIAAAMMQAMAAILASAGFAVEDANDEYRSHQLRVTDEPAQAVPMWTLRDEEATMPGRQPARATAPTDLRRPARAPRSSAAAMSPHVHLITVGVGVGTLHTGFTTSGTPENALKPR
ncbi:hypothetical protein AB0I51_12160 [Streptomyces sp. NPDC050549]|uniref:hypothetical protein n=1 Tax=Streptomyces sp. NPDC050549 TaxID=3155406 RepID=UPI0034421500